MLSDDHTQQPTHRRGNTPQGQSQDRAHQTIFHHCGADRSGAGTEERDNSALECRVENIEQAYVEVPADKIDRNRCLKGKVSIADAATASHP